MDVWISGWFYEFIDCIFSQLHLQFQCGLARYAEQAGESIHARMKPVLQNHKRKPGHKDHGERQQRAIVEFSSNNI